MSLLSWTYEGSDEERKGDAGVRQHARSGDAVYDDERGVGIMAKIFLACGACVRLGQHLAQKWC